MRELLVEGAHELEDLIGQHLDPADDLRVVELFAFLHDSRRENEYDDPAHGRRACVASSISKASACLALSLTRHPNAWPIGWTT